MAMRKRVKHISLVSSGIVLCSIGAVGVLLPIVPGFAPFIVGIYILSLAIPRIKDRLNRFFAASPTSDRIWKWCDQKIRKYVE